MQPLLAPALEDYVFAHTKPPSPLFEELREETYATMKSPQMQVGRVEGAVLRTLVAISGARSILEIGTFTGYSALAVALALPADGRVLACDISDEYTRVGRPFWRQAGVEDRIELVLGPALATLDARLAQGEAGAYDLAFIDADKAGYAAYYERCLQLVRPGGLIAIDNTLWGGSVAKPAAADDADTRALQAVNERLHRDERVDLALLTVGDGLTLARRR